MARRKKNSPLLGILMAFGLVVGGTQALWQNEARFDYHRAASEAHVIEAPEEASPGETVSLTNALRTTIPIEGRYVERFVGYHVIRRSAEIYSWDESEDEDGDTNWSRGWYPSLQSNARNQGLRKRLGAGTLYPPVYVLGTLEISPQDIHFVDGYDRLSPGGLTLSESGRALGLDVEGRFFYVRASTGGTTLGDERLSFRGIPNQPVATYFGAVSNGIGRGRQHEVPAGFIASVIGNDGILHHIVNGGRETALLKVRLDLIRIRWIVRVGGTAAIVLGLSAFFGVFASLLYRIPVLGRMVRTGVGMLSVSIGVPFAVLVILASIAVHSPLTAVMPALLLGGAAVYFRRRARETQAAAESMLTARVDARRRTGLAGSASPGEAAPTRDQELLEDTFSHLTRLAYAESGIDRREARFLSRWGRRNGIPGGRMRILLAGARGGSDIPDASSRDDLELLVLMALADGFMSSRELRALRRIGQKLGVPSDELRDMVMRVEPTTF
jgi:hypothetical protein